MISWQLTQWDGSMDDYAHCVGVQENRGCQHAGDSWILASQPVLRRAAGQGKRITLACIEQQSSLQSF